MQKRLMAAFAVTVSMISGGLAFALPGKGPDVGGAGPLVHQVQAHSHFSGHATRFHGGRYRRGRDDAHPWSYPGERAQWWRHGRYEKRRHDGRPDRAQSRHDRDGPHRRADDWSGRRHGDPRYVMPPGVELERD